MDNDKNPLTKDEVVSAIRQVANDLGQTPSRSKFIAQSGISEYKVLKHFNSWNDAVKSAGLKPDISNLKLDDIDLLIDWATFVRENRQIPSRSYYQRHGKYSSSVLEKRFGPWSSLPDKFKEYAQNKPEWVDVLALLPYRKQIATSNKPQYSPSDLSKNKQENKKYQRHTKLQDRPLYGNPIDFRGLRPIPFGIIIAIGRLF